MRAEHFRVVSTIDPAIATERMPLSVMRKYRESRDFEVIKPYLDDAKKATVFHVREIPADLFPWVASAPSETERNRRAFICGVTEVNNLRGRDGVAIPEWRPVGKFGEHQILSEQECNARIKPLYWEEIGSVVFEHSFLPLEIEAEFPLPSSCLELLGRRTFLPAEANQSAAA